MTFSVPFSFLSNLAMERGNERSLNQNKYYNKQDIKFGLVHGFIITITHSLVYYQVSFLTAHFVCCFVNESSATHNPYCVVCLFVCISLSIRRAFFFFFFIFYMYILNPSFSVCLVLLGTTIAHRKVRGLRFSCLLMTGFFITERNTSSFFSFSLTT